MTTKAPAGRSLSQFIWSIALALIGAVIFAYLIKQTGVSVHTLRSISVMTFVQLVAISAIVIVLDATAWRILLHAHPQCRFTSILMLRICGDALTNSLPGGVLLGEPYKAFKLRQWHDVSLAEGAAVQVMMKLALGISQSLFVLIGLAVCYPLLRRQSVALFGFAGAHYVALVAALVMLLILIVPMLLLLKQNMVEKLTGALRRVPLKSMQQWIDQNGPRIDAFDQTCRTLIAQHRRQFLGAIGVFLIGWFVTATECYVLLSALAPHAARLLTALAIESLGSLFRLIFFMVPSGIGGQDASFVALFRLYSLPLATAGLFVVVRRIKELVWVGVGLAGISLIQVAQKKRSWTS